ncbi:hypothetical protein K7711_09930 [Nocardia sp. CA2R105]|uniref:DUF4286 family protein n=1 Tax=Nocardia coffeae TaxID=2873381 RepID=UPI001CA6F4BB|nr:DUF4286 family protein [Nocardia coffeae]MBY8856794.1 hypothetical protein [Nocardia coffeae]
MTDTFIQIVYSNPVAGREDEFNEWYDNVHVPQLLAVPGMRSAQRYTLRDSEIYRAPGASTPEQRYAIIYEMQGEAEAIMAEIRARVASGQIRMHDSLDMSSWRLAFWTPRGPRAESK